MKCSVSAPNTTFQSIVCGRSWYGKDGRWVSFRRPYSISTNRLPTRYNCNSRTSFWTRRTIATRIMWRFSRTAPICPVWRRNFAAQWPTRSHPNTTSCTCAILSNSWATRRGSGRILRPSGNTRRMQVRRYFLFSKDTTKDYFCMSLVLVAIQCGPDEFNCEDSTCIASSLKCNGLYNCRFRWDEDNCEVSIFRKELLKKILKFWCQIQDRRKFKIFEKTIFLSVSRANWSVLCRVPGDAY